MQKSGINLQSDISLLIAFNVGGHDGEQVQVQYLWEWRLENYRQTSNIWPSNNIFIVEHLLSTD